MSSIKNPLPTAKSVRRWKQIKNYVFGIHISRVIIWNLNILPQ
jgi:hypothetical protein